jgi:hypothetical protein
MEEAFHEWPGPGGSCPISDAPAGRTSIRICTATDRSQAIMRDKELGARPPLPMNPGIRVGRHFGFKCGRARLLG